MKPFFLSFVAIFVAMDVVGMLPIFLSLTEGVEKAHRRKVLLQAMVTGAAVALVFMFGGKWLFGAIGVTIPDFRVAGGLILLVFAIHDLLFSPVGRKQVGATIGVVPIGIPLLVGPAVLTGLLLSMDQYGVPATVVSLALNMTLAFLVFHYGNLLIRLIGEGGAKGIGKVASLLLAAIAVMMIRVGIEAMMKL